MKWPSVKIETTDGMKSGIAPQIISASRATDIPAFHAEWFAKRLDAGYVRWVNPFNQESQYISLMDPKVIVFWSKNPAPMIPHLAKLDKRNISYYFQFTVNDYDKDDLEPRVPPLDERIKTFKKLSKQIGKEKVIWRFDPLILTENISVRHILNKIKKVGEALHPYTEKLVFSFADISSYAKVMRKLQSAGINYKEFTNDEMNEIAKGISQLNNSWSIKIATCAEKINLDEFGIEHNKCIDDDLIMRITNNDNQLLGLLGRDTCRQTDMFTSTISKKKTIKDKGQRLECGCIISKDIGQYNTCFHLCRYCYANISEKAVIKNCDSLDTSTDSIIRNRKEEAEQREDETG